MPEQIEPNQLNGSVILVGITRFDEDGNYEQSQFAGKASVRDADTYCLVDLTCTDGEVRSFPFDRRSLAKARPGDYRLRSTGETITDPDYLMTWEVHKGQDDE